MATIRSTTLWTVLAALVAFAALAFAATAGAGNGAAVFQSGVCDYDLDDVIAVHIDDTRKQKIETKNGNIIITCHFTADDITLGEPMRISQAGFVCTVSGVDTTDSYFHMNKQGTATVHCVVHH
jgi:hypothetical protein